MFLSSELSDVKEHDKIITREAQKTQEDVSVCGIRWLVETGWWQSQAQGGVNVLVMFVGLYREADDSHTQGTDGVSVFLMCVGL